MGIFDALNGNASSRAAKINQAAIGAGTQLGADALTTGANNAIGYLGVRDGGTALGSLAQGYGQARTDVAGGYDAAAPMLARLGGAYDPMVAGGQRAFDAYGDAIGANGPEGNARATTNFRAAPGYEFQRDQGLESIMRTAASRGSLAGGNVTADLLKYSQGLADQSYGDYVDNLRGGAGFYETGLAGQRQGLGAQANAAIGRGTALGALGADLGQRQASVFDRGAGVQIDFGRGVAGLQANAMGSLVQNNNNLAQAKTEASGNFLGALLGGAKALAGGNIFGAGQLGGGGWGGG